MSHKSSAVPIDAYNPPESIISKIADANAQFNFRKANLEETIIGLDLGARLIGKDLAPLDAVRRIDVHTQCTVWVNGNPVEGVHFMIPLTELGTQAVRHAEFDPNTPNLAHCARPNDIYCGVYVGAYAGATREVRKNIMQGAAAIRVMCFANVPCFARAATDDGARSMQSLGFAPVQGDRHQLWVQEALVSTNQVSA